jgi:hypothetical protein
VFYTKVSNTDCSLAQVPDWQRTHEKGCGLIARILKCVRRSRRNNDVIAGFGIDVLAVFGEEADCALGYQEGLVVLLNISIVSWATRRAFREGGRKGRISGRSNHFVPMCWRAFCRRGEGDLGGPYTII